MIANIQLQEAKVAFNRLFEISSVENEFETAGKMIQEIKADEANGTSILALKNISYRFPGKSLTIQDIGFQVKTGEIISVFGQVGSGKSTLVDLIQGFYLPEKGVLRLDGKDFNKWDLPLWRSKIAVVAQSEKIFNSTILDNICLSNDPHELQQGLKFIQSAGLEPFFNQLPLGLLTLCEEEGRSLSGGQRQLVTIARALYKQPSFLLLDESTSAMDFETENKVLAILRKHSNTMGVILITHRIGLARQTDRILILNNGRLESMGCHAELVVGQNEYARAFEQLTLLNSFK
jgi:ATP-binding cassette subfamily B protein